MDDREKLRRSIEQQAQRMARADRERPTLMAQTAFLGVLALLLVVPLVAGAYLGNWLDSLHAGYSVRWTVSLILVGLGVGIVNVYWFIRAH
jgi:ATP synthase protein I